MIRHNMALVLIRTRYRLELVRIWIEYAPQVLPHRIRRRVWLYRRLLRNWYRDRTGYEQREQLEALTDHGFIDRIA